MCNRFVNILFILLGTSWPQILISLAREFRRFPYIILNICLFWYIHRIYMYMRLLVAEKPLVSIVIWSYAKNWEIYNRTWKSIWIIDKWLDPFWKTSFYINNNLFGCWFSIRDDVRQNWPAVACSHMKYNCILHIIFFLLCIYWGHMSPCFLCL